jgi:hypothetical protein
MRRAVVLALLLLSSPLCHAENFFTGLVDDVVSDYKSFYTQPDWIGIGAVVGTAGLFANTGIDRAIRTKWQSDIQGDNTQWIRDWGNDVGGAPQVGFYLPLYLTTYWFGAQFSDNPAANIVSQWSNRAFRITALIAPQQLALTHLTGAARPEIDDSHWRPFKNKRGVSGHAAYGAVPFLSAATLTENPLLKTLLIGASVLPGLARIDNDAHYFSQAVFGWGITWLASRSVGDNKDAPHWIAYHDQERFMLGYRFIW